MTDPGEGHGCVYVGIGLAYIGGIIGMLVFLLWRGLRDAGLV